jgi:hypothetical protein
VGRADIIDFETGFQRLDPVGTVITATNEVTFSTAGLDNTPPFVAKVGTTPKDAFEAKVDGIVYGDTPQGGTPGDYFMTDGAGSSNDYLFDLELPVGEFAVDLYDFVGDGGAIPTDFVALRAFSDHTRTDQVASSTYIVPRPRPADGLAVNLAVSAPSIVALTLQFSTFDRGTGVDNIRFVTVPEPFPLTLGAIGWAWFVGCIWRRRRRSA